jgi:hypothetical protein
MTKYYCWMFGEHESDPCACGWSSFKNIIKKGLEELAIKELLSIMGCNSMNATYDSMTTMLCAKTRIARLQEENEKFLAFIKDVSEYQTNDITIFELIALANIILEKTNPSFYKGET